MSMDAKLVKDGSQVGELWPNTIPIDTWIIEETKFFTNNWGQTIQPGSHCLFTHENTPFNGGTRPGPYDLIAYSVSQVIDHPIFHIRYYDSYCSVSQTRDETDHAAKLEYAKPTFFKELDRVIWRIRTIRYIQADLKSVAENIQLLEQTIWEDRDWYAQADLVGDIYDSTGRLDKMVRGITRKYTDKRENVSYPLIEGGRLAQKEDVFESDQVPF